MADSPREAREKLRAQGLVVETVVPQVEAAKRHFRLRDRAGRHASQLSSAIRDLATLLATGIGLVDALDTLCAQYKGRFQSSLMSLRERVASGSSLSEAMADEPGMYDELTMQMVRVGENAGTLDTVLDRLADFRERYLLFKDRITTALMYPAIVISLAIGVSIFLMTVVLPMLLENLVESGRPLPWPTRVLKWMSQTAINHGWWIAIALGVAAMVVAALLRTAPGKRLWHRTLFALPILGPLARKQEIARAAIVISTLMRNGIVFVDAVEIAGRVTGNVLLRDALDTMRASVQSGRDIGEALQATGAFPPMVVQIFVVGQQTGQLEDMLDRLASGYERQVASATARLSAALEPILIVCLAIFVGFILFATILPILEAGNVL
ncbi:type II secretion system F family protein [Symmachiella dynata]|uniref:type II secretion system F family protein n=1 Tax=Symmachiella dynata TaxID=2527995 RepID=UPI0030EF32FA